MQEPLEFKTSLLESSIEKCETAAYRARHNAASLRHEGFDGKMLGELISQLQEALEQAYSYQAYMNVLDE